MFFKQMQTPGLGCFSYLVGCPAAGVMCVVDPRRDVAEYLEVAAAEGMRITHVFETHVHADHVSGAQELRAATGAEICVHESADVAYPHTPIKHGETFRFGSATLEILHTPGHTPNSVSILVTDTLRFDQPELILTGDLLFVGDVGRPDLPGHEILGEQVENLYRSLHHVLGSLPDSLEVYPAHGQGSLCGRGMSAKSSSTLGYERQANPMLRHKSLETFRTAILSALPVRPQSFTHIIKTNLAGAPLLERCPISRALTVAQFEQEMKNGAVVIDTRDASAFGGAHIPGSLNIGFEKQMANWVGMAVRPDARILLVVDGRERYEAMGTELHRIGYDDILGYLADGVGGWIRSGRPIANLAQISVHGLKALFDGEGETTLLDVRTPAEWESGHIAQARHMPFSDVLKNGPDTCLTGPVQVICGSGYRSNIVGSLLAAGGCAEVSSVAGGMLAWRRAGYPVES